MNAKPKQSASPLKLDWKKIAIIAIVLAVGGYQWYTENNSADKSVAVEVGQSPTDSDDQQASSPASKNKNNGPARNSTGRPALDQKQAPEGSYLKPSSGRNLKSPAGLIYTSGRNEHRSDHVLRHAHDIPDRENTHGVFDANGDDVFRLLDEAYELIKSNSRQVKTTPASGGKTEYVIEMKRKIGYKGGKPGKRQNNPSLYKIKLILGDDRVITAFPY